VEGAGAESARASTYSEAGAADLARQCEDPVVRAKALATAATASGRSGARLAEEAIETACEIPDVYAERVSALAAVACVLAEASLTPDAERAAELAAAAAPSVTRYKANIQGGNAPQSACVALVTALIAVDRLEEAAEVAGRLGAEYGGQGQGPYVDALIKAGEYAKAGAFAGETSDRYGTRSRLLSKVAAAQAQHDLLADAAQTVDGIEGKYERWRALKALAEGYAAASMYGDAERVLESIEHEDARAEAVRSVVGVMLDRGLSAEASELFTRFREGDTRGDAVAWASAVREAAVAYAVAGRGEAARALFEQADQATEAIDADILEARCLRDLALAYVAADVPSDAAKTVERLWRRRGEDASPLDMSEERDLMSLGDQTVHAANAVADAMAAHGHTREAETLLSSLRPLYYSHASLTDAPDSGRAPTAGTLEEVVRAIDGVSIVPTDTARALAQAGTLWAGGRLNDAIDALSDCEVDYLLLAFAVWSRQPEMRIDHEALSKATKICGWARSDWRSLAARVFGQDA